ncbi:hypothetical protein [Candidatus Ichthyocystis sparus]|uniref:hypothetical protein n=1 Tax=Candidatus Ichthyocystis sparus TaxID=1561004 RepID=UPI000B80E10E|nr:hypothetical protein [Candidatus Ichthyocystis sparus]
MSDRITLGASDSSSDSEAGEPTNDVGGNSSSLGAVGQDRGRRSGESGSGGRSGRGSLTSPGRAGQQELGAKPKKWTGRKEERGSKATGKGVVWNKEDRRRAKLHRGKGQKLAADRAAARVGEEADKCKEVRTTEVRALGQGPRGRHGPGSSADQHRKKKPDGGGGDIFGLRELVLTVLVSALLAAFFTYDLLSIEDPEQNHGSITGISRVEMAELGVGSFVIMLIFLAMLVSNLSNRNRKT